MVGGGEPPLSNLSYNGGFHKVCTFLIVCVFLRKQCVRLCQVDLQILAFVYISPNIVVTPVSTREWVSWSGREYCR